MATSQTMTGSNVAAAQSDDALLVVLPSLQQAQFEAILVNLRAALPGQDLVISAPEGISPDAYPDFRFATAPPAKSSWTLTAADFVNAHQAAAKNQARAILMLGPESQSLGTSGLRDLANGVLAAPNDLVVPWYDLPPRAGLVNSSILYPLTRGLFATRVHFPLAVDLGLSLRMAERLAGAGQRLLAMNQSDAPLWPVSEATTAGMTIDQVDVGTRALPQPADPDLNSVLPFVTGSLFSDIEAKAAFWQRARVTPAAPRKTPTAQSAVPDATAEVASIVQGFRLAHSNLRDIWGLVLPPNSLLALKRLSLVDASDFRMPEPLWVRIVFDFLIAYRLRTINRGHLLGALIPLYLAWVASHINIVSSGANPDRHIEALATAFEADKPYLVARWRWPDRFNP